MFRKSVSTILFSLLMATSAHALQWGSVSAGSNNVYVQAQPKVQVLQAVDARKAVKFSGQLQAVDTRKTIKFGGQLHAVQADTLHTGSVLVDGPIREIKDIRFAKKPSVSLTKMRADSRAVNADFEKARKLNKRRSMAGNAYYNKLRSKLYGGQIQEQQAEE